MLKCIYYVVIICLDYLCFKVFYMEILGLCVLVENYCVVWDFYKLDLVLFDGL